MNEYDKMAMDFAARTGTRLKVLDQDYKPMWGESTPRCVFKCRLSRNGRYYTFEFGQSIANGSKPPRMYDVLACLTKSDPGTFEDFCDEFGYDTDSRRSERTYKAVCKEWKAVERLFGDVLEDLWKIG